MNRKLWSSFIAFCVLVGSFIFTYKVLQDDPKILCDQVGYLPGGKKIALIQTRFSYESQPLSYQIIEQVTGAATLKGSLNFLGKLWGWYYYAADFTTVSTPGNYTLHARLGVLERNSGIFSIGDKYYMKLAERVSQFFYYQRCGCRVEEIVPRYVGHEPCHLDDGIFYPEGSGSWLDLTGGWHSAGDYAKHNYWGLHIIGSTYSLAYAFEKAPQLFSGIDLYALDGSAQPNGIPDIVDELIFGAQYLDKAFLPNGSLIGSLVGDLQFFPPEKDTDNIPGTEDDRVLFAGEHHEFASFSEAMWAVAAFAKIARLCAEYGYHPSWEVPALQKAQWILGNYSGQAWGPNAVLWFGPHVVLGLACWELYRYDPGDPARAVYATNATRHFQQAGNLAPIKDFNDLGADDRLLGVFFNWALENGSTSALELARAVISTRYESQWQPLSGGDANYFGLYRVFQGDQIAYFNSPVGLGLNSYYLSGSFATLLAAKITGESVYKNFALDQLHWILGRNPFSVCMVEGVGHTNPPLWHHRYGFIPGNTRGAVPGAIANGIHRDTCSGRYTKENAPDIPYFMMDGRGLHGSSDMIGIPASSNEPWLPHNVNMLFTLAALAQIL